MTPFGARLRALRAERKMTLRAMADGLGVSAAYLSALEHGRRGTPSSGLIHQICERLDLIWDEAHELADLARDSRPRISLHTGGLTPAQTALANRFARQLRHLPDETVAAIDALLRETPGRPAPSLRRSRSE